MSALEHLARNDFADRGVADVVHRALVRRTEVHPALAENPNLSPSAWMLLYTPKSSIPVSKLLVGRTLDNERLRLVLTTESRDSVLAACISCNVITDAEVALIPARRRRGRTAAAIAAATSVSVQTRISLVAQLGLIDRLLLAGEPGICIDDTCVASWFPRSVLDQPVRSKSVRSAAYALLLHHRRSLVDVLISSGNAAAVIAAASSPAAEDSPDGTLLRAVMDLRADDRKFALMAFSANPRISPATLQHLVNDQRLHPSEIDQVSETLHRRRNDDPVLDYDKVERPLLDRLLRRALPSEYRPGGRPSELLAIAGNPALGSDVERVHNALDTLLHHSVWGPTVSSYRCGTAAVCDLQSDALSDEHGQVPDAAIIHRLGEYQPSLSPGLLYDAFTSVATETLGDDANAWESLVSLFDTFTGTAKELIDVATSL